MAQKQVTESTDKLVDEALVEAYTYLTQPKRSTKTTMEYELIPGRYNELTHKMRRAMMARGIDWTGQDPEDR